MTNYDDSTEMAILNAMMEDSNAADIAMHMITAFDFHEPRRGKLFIVLRQLYMSGTFDAAKLSGQIAKHTEKQTLEHALNECMNYIGGSAANIEDYCAKLVEFKVRRLAKSKAKEILDSIDGIVSEHDIATKFSDVAGQLELSLESSTASVQGSTDALQHEMAQALTGERRALAMPWPVLGDRTNALLPGTITVICGSPGASKSLMLLQLLIYLFKNEVKIASLSLEDGTTHQLRRAFAQMAECSNVTNDKWCMANPDIMEKLSEWKEYLKSFGKNLFELHRDELPTVGKALDWVSARARAGARVITLDPFTLLDFGPKPWLSEREFLTKAKRIMEQHKASLILVTHPRKQGVSGQKAPTATMDDIAGSSAISRFVHTIIWLRIHAAKTVDIDTGMGIISESINRTVLVMKARNALGGSAGVGLWFNVVHLKLEEKGMID